MVIIVGDLQPDVDMNWTMMYFLPQTVGCRSSFQTIIAGYLLLVYKKNLELIDETQITTEV